MLYQPAEPPALLNGHEAARRFFSPSFSGKNQSREHLLVAHVDSAARCIHVEHYQGDFTSVGLPVRQIVSDAAKFGSAGVVLAHNHPSGDCRPSDSDYRATRRLARVVKRLTWRSSIIWFSLGVTAAACGGWGCSRACRKA